MSQSSTGPADVRLPQISDPNNTTLIVGPTGPPSTYTGAWTQTRAVGIVRQLTVLASNVPTGLGGTFTFEYSEDGVAATISEARNIGDFSSVRDFDLLNAGAWYRVKFLPSRALVGGEAISITTTQRTQNDGAFARLADQQIEKSNAAMGQTFAYLKAFDSITGKSRNISAHSSEGGGTSLDVVMNIPGVGGTLRGRVVTNSTSEVPVRSTAYVEQTSGAQRSIASTSANDAAAGTGARSVRITYYTLSGGVVGGPFTEDVTLNGTTPVNTVATDIALIEQIRLVTAGSGGVAAGIIQLFTGTSGGGSVFASIAAGVRETFYAHHYIPSGRTMFITDAYASSTASQGNVQTFVARRQRFDLANAAEVIVIDGLEVQGSGGANQVLFTTPRTVRGPARLTWYVTPQNSNSATQKLASSYHEQDTV